MHMMVHRLYHFDPLNHVYLLYNLAYCSDRTEVCFTLDIDHIKEYVLLWRGMRDAIPVWGRPSENCIKEVLSIAKPPLIVQVYDRAVLETVKHYLYRLGVPSMSYFLDMINQS